MKHLDYDLPPEDQAKTLKLLHKDVLVPDSIESKLDTLEIEVFKLFQPECKIKPLDRIIHMRDFCQKKGLKLTDSEIRQKIWQGRRLSEGAVEMYECNQIIDCPEETWAWEGIIMSADANLLISLPKCGKTTLIIDLIATWSRGNDEFLGQKLIGKCPPVIIVGTDMTTSRWMPLLHRFGLAEKVAATKYKPIEPIVGVFAANNPLHLTQEGLERIAEIARNNKGALFLFDSFAKLVAPLGLKESSEDIAHPLADLQEVLAPYQCTSIIIHHSGKTKEDSPVLASRGSTALTAAVSQIISLSWFKREEDRQDKRILMRTMGRAEDIQLLMSQETSGWMLEGSVAEELKKEEFNKKLEKLTDNQAEVFEYVQSANGREVTATEIQNELNIVTRSGVRILQALAKKGFLIQNKSSNPESRGSVLTFKIKPL
ncbi:AAA family ATPase [Prochlorococcus marinus str. XMU1401]|uniref:AAA family ATPase n=1 Tax=Prochlorococcus marinus str. XMU1401 TaxID=2052594 RepID=A0A8I1X0C2_PROMR|nr:AAA family ATPase [Prochlorococcus marinus]MBO8223081.1 AAA family ATPase [Prochlorococcus marinus str. XMU1401]